MRDQHNHWVEESEELAGLAIKYFESIFHSGTCQRMEECLRAVQHKVTPAMQDILSSDYSVEEIKAAWFQMGPIKAPGPDGILGGSVVYYRYSTTICRLIRPMYQF